MSSSEESNVGKSHPMPFTRIEVVVLSIVDGELCVLLAKRSAQPFAGKWALPGGVLRIDLDSSLEGGAQRVINERLGIDLPFLEQLCAVGGPQRDPRASWALSVVYRALLSIQFVRASAGKRIESLKWEPAESAMKLSLAFDHAELIRKAVMTTREEVAAMVMPQSLMLQEFSLSELQTTCEQVLGHALDKSSFRRKLADRGLVVPVSGAMKSGAFRPAQLYRMTTTS
jgi:8-oxo-dGTP diphosphatase